MTVQLNVELGAFLVKDRKVIAERMDHVRELFPIVAERAKTRPAVSPVANTTGSSRAV